MAEFRGIVRVANKDVDGNMPVQKALTKIKGIGVNLADTLAEIAASELNIPKREKIGNLTDKQLDQLEEMMMAPEKHGVPAWMLNRRSTGQAKHLISSDLEFQQRLDVTGEKNIRSYRGVRHMFGLPVRGQRTKTMGRSGATLGVVKKKEEPAKAGEKPAEKGGKEKKK